ncbi:phosphoserine phosphatase SerB [Pseudocolwellia sp. HL-MZ19]|uniref:phosphoserine phosphatase SerB n=1 Tax=unclassified Pseudocolwellia TaxID=2848178 RepID=UPI003CEFB488
MQKFTLETINSFSLSQVILPAQTVSSFPFSVALTANNFTIDDNCLCDTSIASTVEQSSPSANVGNSTELVVFSDISIALFSELTLACDLSLNALIAINHRNNLISYRFAISVDEISVARQKLISFAEANNIEAAILLNAPKLETPGLLVMDMDSTTIEIECIDEIAILAGVGEQVSAVTELAMQGQLDFSESLYQRVATLENASEQILADVAKDIPLMMGLETLITELKKHQWRVAIASGGFTYFADHLKDMLSLDAAFANTLEIIDGKLTGKVLGRVVDANVKAECLTLLSNEYNIPHQQTVAMGDGANDLVMMEAANLGIAFHAKSIVKAKADTAINTSGLDCMIHWLA